MSEICSFAKAELDRGYKKHSLRAKFTTLSKQREKGTLKADAGIHGREGDFVMVYSTGWY